MDTITILEQAKELGLSLSIDGDKLNVTGPKTPAAAALVAQMAQHKAAVIAHLTQPPTPAPTSDLAFTLADVDELSFDAPAQPAAGFYRRTYGTIAAYTGQTLTPADALYEVKRTSPLHRGIFEGYKKWLWQQMQTDAAVLAELFEIANLAYCGCNTYIRGNNAAAIAAAATYELQQAPG